MVDKSIHICHSICQAVEFIHARQDSFGCQRFPLAHRDIKVFHRANGPMASETLSKTFRIFFQSNIFSPPISWFPTTERMSFWLISVFR